MVDVSQSKLIQTYNKFMGGVDHHDWPIGKHGTNKCMDFILQYARSKSKLFEVSLSCCTSIPKLKSMSKTPNQSSVPMRGPSTLGLNHFIQYRQGQRRCQRTDYKSRSKSFCSKCCVTLCANCILPYHQK